MSSLKSINLSNFDTSNTHFFDNLFNGCSSLTFIDFRNIDLSSAEKMDNKFSNCKNLEYINIKNYIPKNIEFTIYIFKVITNKKL